MLTQCRGRSLGLFTWATLTLMACAHAVDSTGIDANDSATDPNSGAGFSSTAGSVSDNGGASAGGDAVSSAGEMASAGRAAGGAAAAAGSGNEAGHAEVAGSSPGGASHGGSANSAGASTGGASHGGASSAGASSAGASTGGAKTTGSACDVTIDLNGYTPSKAGCGGYADCKGQIHWRNNETQTLTQIELSFSVAAGTSCTSDNATSKWTITDNGAASHQCVFTAQVGALSIASKAALSFGYDTNQSDGTAPSTVTISDPSCK